MATYFLVNLIYILVVIVGLGIKPKKPSKSIVLTLGSLLLLTAVFDSLIVGFSIVGYSPDRIIGIFIGKAPVEDFFYAVLAVILVPTIWKLKDKKYD